MHSASALECGPDEPIITTRILSIIIVDDHIAAQTDARSIVWKAYNDKISTESDRTKMYSAMHSGTAPECGPDDPISYSDLINHRRRRSYASAIRC